MTEGQFVLLILILVLILVFVGLPWLSSRRRSEDGWDSSSAYLDAIEALVAGRRHRAVESLRAIARREPEGDRIYLVLGDLVRSMGHADKAQRIHAGLVARPGKDPELLQRARESLIADCAAQSRWDEVIRLAEPMGEGHRHRPAVLRPLVRAYEAREDWDKAFAACDEWERAEPGRAVPSPAQLRTHVAARRLDEDRTKEARRLLEEALKIDDGTEEARVLFGDVLAREGEHEKAVEQWMEFARRRPDRAHAVFDRLERSYYEMGRFGDLVVVYERLVQQSPSSVRATVALAEMHRRRGRPEEAVPILESLLAGDPANRAARRLLVACLLQARRTEAAIAEMDALLRCVPDAGALPPCAACGADRTGFDPRCPRCGAWRTGPEHELGARELA